MDHQSPGAVKKKRQMDHVTQIACSAFSWRVENLSAGQMCTEEGAKSCAPNAGGWISDLVWALYTSGNKEGSEGREDT